MEGLWWGVEGIGGKIKKSGRLRFDWRIAVRVDMTEFIGVSVGGEIGSGEVEIRSVRDVEALN